MYKISKIRDYSGIVLIELMVALSLSLLLLRFVFEIVVTSERYFRLQTALQQNQESALTALDILSSAIHQAGHIGCPRLTRDFQIYSIGNYAVNAQNKLIGISNNVLTVRYAEYPPAVLIAPMRDNKTLHISKNIPIKSNDIVLISDCKHAELAKIDSMTSNYLTTQQSLHGQFDSMSELSRLQINTYFIAKTVRKDQSGAPIYALFVRDINARTMELVEGISNMLLTYMLYQEGRIVALSANDVVDWSQVRAVAIDLEVSVSPIKKRWHAYVAL